MRIVGYTNPSENVMMQFISTIAIGLLTRKQLLDPFADFLVRQFFFFNKVFYECFLTISSRFISWSKMAALSEKVTWRLRRFMWLRLLNSPIPNSKKNSKFQKKFQNSEKKHFKIQKMMSKSNIWLIWKKY